MGGSQSYLYVYLQKKNNKYGEKGYGITSNKKMSSDCKTFEVVTHEIKYNVKDPRYFDIYIYNGGSDYIFAYCSPSLETQVITSINVYYSVLENNKPLVISFIIKSGHVYNCTFNTLKSARWDYASNITRYNFSEPLSKKLPELYNGISFKKTIKFVTDKSGKINVKDTKEIIINEEHFKFIYTPSGDNASISNNDLFTSLSDPKATNRLDYSYVAEVKDHYFDGIALLCTKDNTTLVLEFLYDCGTKEQYVRKDKDATYWVKEEVKYDSDKSLNTKLDELKKQATDNDIVTYMLNRTDKYNEVSVTPDEKKTTYNKYTHTSKEIKKPNILFNKKQIKKFGTHDPPEKTKILDVYYLKANNIRDITPFLLVFNENGTQPQPPPKPGPETSKNKCFHFKNTYNFDDWIELKDPKKLQEKLDKIESSGKCTVELYLLRKLAYEILIEEETPSAPPTEPASPPKRPEVLPPPTVRSLTLKDILIYIASGLVVTGIIGGVLYGIYWYNTTIKLLT